MPPDLDQAGKRPPGAGDRNNSSSLRRALSVVDFIAEHSAHAGDASLGELAAGLGLSKSTLLRLITPLRDARLIERAQDSGRYRLGPRCAYLGEVYLDRLDLRAVAHGVLQQMVEQTGETAHMVTFDSPEMVYIDKVESPSTVRMFSRIGSRQPAYCTAVGKAFLAFSADQTVEEVIAAGLSARTPNTITDPGEFRLELARIRERGWSLDDIENEAELRCVAAPVFNHSNQVVAAVSISGPAGRLTRDRAEKAGQRIKAWAGEISCRLGGTPPAA
jgi:DNA-binding IclR family transcriptional regulator